MKIRRPLVLQPGDRVALVAPAGPSRGEKEIAACVEALESMELRVVRGKSIAKRIDYLAGSDSQRAADLNAAFRDPLTRAIFCIRGGYGCARLLDRTDWKAISSDPKLLVGFSDLTALQCGLLSQSGIASLHTPTVAFSFVNQKITRRSMALMKHMLFESEPVGSMREAMNWKDGEVWRKGRARGTLIGGNLTLLASLAGTRYLPDAKGCILFLEEISEEPYRLDRMIHQLKMCGFLSRVAAVVLGQFTDCKSEHPDRRGPMEVLRECLKDLRVPIIANFPAGHVRNSASLLIGGEVEVESNGDLVAIQGLTMR